MKTFSCIGQPASLFLLSLLAAHTSISAAEINPAPPRITIKPGTNGPAQLVFPYPAAQQYNVFSAPDANSPFTPDTTSGRLLGPVFQVTNGGPNRLYTISVVPMSSNDIFTATVLNRLTYGPSPDDLDHIRAVGPEVFISEQMAPENITEFIDTAPPITNAPIILPPPPPLTNWIRASVTGLANAGTNFFIYLNAVGHVYVDDVRMVLGTNADSGPNLLTGGDFEDPILTNTWIVSSDFRNSVITNSPTVDGLAPSGTNCLHVVATAAGAGNADSIQVPFGLTNYPASQRVTISFSYLPVQQAGTNPVSLVFRLSSSSTITTIPLPPGPPTPPSPPTPPPAISVAYGKLSNTNATLDDLRAWHVYRAIHSKRQLHEVLAQFFQNHLTTQHDKLKDFFDNNYNVGVYTNDSIRQAISVDLNWREHKKIRDTLLDPSCTFYDLLKVSIESPAMVIYLDTQLNSRAAPNQNYGREILELHTMGADNGYIQQDIVDLAKVWTGWRVAKKDAANASNPFAVAISGGNTNIANTPGIWTLNYVPGSHDSNSVKRLFTNNVIAGRFGAGFGGGTSYALIIPSGAPATFTNGFGEGYTVARHLANLPYTMEFLSVKLCQLFVHEGFEYGVYDYTAPNPTPEVQLVKACMSAWNTPDGGGNKGNIRSVINVIFQSALFRGHAASQQKVKTPLEYAVSAVRALRVTSTDTNSWVSSTADSDGYGIINPLSRMGGMGLFNKPEPDGFSEKGSLWLSTANLSERLRYVQHLLEPGTSALKNSSSNYGTPGTKNTSDPSGLIRIKLPPANWNDPGAIVDLFLGFIYPGEGPANLGIDRQSAIDYLGTDDSGARSTFNLASHDNRVRGMVGLLFSLPRFHEQ